jgi:hypothetical protein
MAYLVYTYWYKSKYFIFSHYISNMSKAWVWLFITRNVFAIWINEKLDYNQSWYMYIGISICITVLIHVIIMLCPKKPHCEWNCRHHDRSFVILLDTAYWNLPKLSKMVTGPMVFAVLSKRPHPSPLRQTRLRTYCGLHLHGIWFQRSETLER